MKASSTLTQKLSNNNQHIPMSASQPALCVMAGHVGLKSSELESTTRFEEIGLDWLLSLSVSVHPACAAGSTFLRLLGLSDSTRARRVLGRKVKDIVLCLDI